MTNQIVFYSMSKKDHLSHNKFKLVEIDKVVFLTPIILVSFLENLVKMIYFTILVFTIWFNLMKFKLL